MQGAAHDSTVASSLYQRLRASPAWCQIGVDGAYDASVCGGRMLKPLTGPQLTRASLVLGHRDLVRLIKRGRAMISSRQSAEWGMKAVQGTWGVLQTRLPVGIDARKLILGLCVKLHNFRVRLVGLKQLQTVYAREYLDSMY